MNPDEQTVEPAATPEPAPATPAPSPQHLYQEARARVVTTWLRERDLLYLVSQGLLPTTDADLVQAQADAQAAAEALRAVQVQHVGVI